MDVIIAGGGRVGSYLARMLIERGDRVRLIEARPAILSRLARDLPAGVLVADNPADPVVLAAAGARDSDVVAAVTDSDPMNLVITSLARFEFAVPRIIARVNEPRHAWLFTAEMGVDVALDQADVMGRLIAEEMSLGDLMTLHKLRKGLYSLVEEKVDPQSVAAGRAVAELGFPEECALVSIIRKGALLIPRSDTVFQPADEVLAVVHADALARFSALLARRADPPAAPAGRDRP
jgi:trk system potassium uptake protein TrkA